MVFHYIMHTALDLASNAQDDPADGGHPLVQLLYACVCIGVRVCVCETSVVQQQCSVALV
jgi:hypothetical protein